MGLELGHKVRYSHTGGPTFTHPPRKPHSLIGDTSTWMSDSDYRKVRYTTATPEVFVDPVPQDAVVIQEVEAGDYLVVLVRYKTCINYQGLKCIVYKGLKTVKDLKSLDPHFRAFGVRGEGPRPVARFEPTEEGFKMAVEMYTSIGVNNGTR